MAKKAKVSASDILGSLKRDLYQSMEQEELNEIPDIIKFVEDENYLNIKTLTPVQKLTLKVFYRGSMGNEHLELTEEDVEVIKRHKLLDSPEQVDRGNLLEKWNNGTIFRELVLVWGRRSGKDFFTGIVAAYEAMRLIECTNGDPYSYYGISDSAPIYILTIAGSGEQAHTAFNEIQSKILGSNYFSDKLGPESIQAKSISLLTKRDKKLNKERRDSGINFATRGSIHVEVGHSNSDTLRGKQIFTCIMDEIAFYKNTGGSSSGDILYQSLLPAVATFNVDTDQPLLDSMGQQRVDLEGNPEWVKRFDGKMVFISSPAGQEGIFWKLYENAPHVKQRLMLRLPTWEVQTKYRFEDLRRDAAEMSEEQFLMEFGAEFSGTAGMAFFDKALTKKCFQQGGKMSAFGKPGFLYFAHLDPARTSHNFALAVVHRENFRKEDGSKDFRVVVDDLRFWHPTPGSPVNIEQVDEYIIMLKRKFRPKLVTYDHWPIDMTVQKMKKAGIPHMMTQFTHKYKVMIYDELLNLVNGEKLVIPPYGEMFWQKPAAELLHREMDNLQKKVTYNSYRVTANKEADCNTDDLCDALAGACYQCVVSQTKALPSSRTVAMGGVPSANERVWMAPSGPLGYGTGQQVAKRLADRASWPNHLR